jgi:aspartate kinase
LGLDEGERAVVRPHIQGLLSEVRSLCHATAVLRELTPRGLDVISGMGERLSVPLVAAAIRARGLPAEAMEATDLIVTDDQHGGASPLMDETRSQSRARLLPLLERGTVPVITGFIGATASGTPTTLGRGGSDYSATILGACLDSDEIWIWSDVDGVLSADPRVVPDARTIATLSYAEAAEFSYFGAKVIHPKTILPAVDDQIPLRILNSFEPERPGTRIMADPPPNGRVVKGITAIKQVSEITVEGRGMIGIPGIAARVFGAVADEQVNVLMISQSSSEQSICFIVPQDAAARTLKALEAAFQYDMLRHNIERVWSQDDVAILAVVGERMKGTHGIAARLFSALSEAGINILTIAQGSSEYNISLVLAGDEVERAVRAVHATFGLGKLGIGDRGTLALAGL